MTAMLDMTKPGWGFTEGEDWTPEFRAFPKIPRFKRYYVITEKIDGTNAAVIVGPDGQVAAQSRKVLITPEKDNFGFASWVQAHADQLRTLGEGHHFGEWYGVGINRAYGLWERRFALFNTSRWDCSTDENTPPSCCSVVPVLYSGHDNLDRDIENALYLLRTTGSVVAPGFTNPEGIVVYHTAAGAYFKILLENDETPKGSA